MMQMFTYSVNNGVFYFAFFDHYHRSTISTRLISNNDSGKSAWLKKSRKYYASVVL